MKDERIAALLHGLLITQAALCRLLISKRVCADDEIIAALEAAAEQQAAVDPGAASALPPRQLAAALRSGRVVRLH